MSRLELSATHREKSRKSALRHLRKNGQVPAIVYGGEDNLLVTLNKKDLKLVLSSETVATNILTLSLPERDNSEIKKQTMIKSLDFHPISYELLHIDFIEIMENKPVTVKVPYKFIGETECAKKGGILTHLLNEIEIKCLPADLPQEVEINLADLELGHSIHVSDLTLGDNIKICGSLTDTIVALAAKDAEEEVVVEPAEGASAEGAEGAEKAEKSDKK